MTSAPFDLAETDRLLSTTRAVRKRLDLDRPVEREVILDCLRLAVQAPTQSNSQTWRWMVVTDPEKKALIAEAYRKVGMGYLEQAAGAEKDPQTQRVYESAVELAKLLERVPAMVIPCVKKDYDPAHGNAVAASVYGSIIPATWSFQLALRSRGLGSVFTTLHLFQDKVVADALGIPDDVLQIALLPVAYTIGTDFKPAVRPPVEQITFWNEWGKSE
ncbi:MAG TPA: nitroreductase family protein [Mycobacteriales bacterium]|nr:nitroreductase family protein [Mycobacteriales bacterium]